jgi:type IV secretory pathway VirJ component
MTPVLVAALALAAAPRWLDVPGTGKVEVHSPEGPPARVVILLSGSDGLEPGTAALADGLAARGALVLSVDTPAYLAQAKERRCAYPAADLEALAQHAQQALGLPAYQRPFLVGHATGAAVAWAALSIGPPGTFAGGVLLAARPGQPLPVRLCTAWGPRPEEVDGGSRPGPGARPGAPLELVTGAADGADPASGAAAFAAAIGARFTAVPGVGHALAPTAPWLEATWAAIGRGAAVERAPAATAPSELAGLPLVEVPAQGGDRLAILLTGDGGWVGLDREVAAALAARGVAVVGLDSLKYFWKKRTPAETAADLARIARHYLAAWNRRTVLLVGYSRGADVLAIVAGRLPADVQRQLRLVAMLGPSTFAELEVHVVDLLASVRRKDTFPTEQAVRDTGGTVPMLCIHGAGEDDSLCPHVRDLPWVKTVVLPGHHHFGGDYGKLAALVLEAAQ